MAVFFNLYDEVIISFFVCLLKNPGRTLESQKLIIDKNFLHGGVLCWDYHTQWLTFIKRKDVLKKYYTEYGKNFQAVFQSDFMVKKKYAVIIVNYNGFYRN